MSAIPFTQYLLPDGRQKQTSIDLPESVAKKAKRIIGAGYRLECEILRTGHVSLTIHDPSKQEDVDIRLTKNGALAVKEAVESLVMDFPIPEETS